MMTNKYTLFQRFDQSIKNDDTLFKEILKNFEPFGGNYSDAKSVAISTSTTEEPTIISWGNKNINDNSISLTISVITTYFHGVAYSNGVSESNKWAVNITSMRRQ